MISFGVRFGAPVCPRPVYVAPACPRPVYVEPVCPAPVVYVPAPVQYGPYYDPGCDRRFSSFELYLEHVSDQHAASVRIRN